MVINIVSAISMANSFFMGLLLYEVCQFLSTALYQIGAGNTTAKFSAAAAGGFGMRRHFPTGCVRRSGYNRRERRDKP